MSTKEELACVYASLLLHDDNVPVTGDKIQAILKAAGVQIDPIWPNLFAKALEGVDVKTLISNVTSGVGAGGAPGGAAGAPAAAAGGKAEAKEEKKEPEKKKEEPKEESDDDMGFGLFD